ncbi:olfactory receptor 5AR1-like [Gastrophryne carolinensis]
MTPSNSTFVKEFVLSGLSSDPKLQLPLFLFFLSAYMVTLLGNFMIILVVRTTPALQTPMYLFLVNLSFLDIFYSSSISPMAMDNIISVSKTITIAGCGTQMFLFIALASSEAMLLAVMAYDRYIAICRPLYYTSIMNQSVCFWVFFSLSTVGCANSLIHTCCAFMLPLCQPYVIHHFFCDINPILKLACKDTFLNEVFLFVVAGSIEVGSFLCIMISYIYILLAICRTSSSRGGRKALSTCASHFCCVSLFYFPVFFEYLRPKSAYVMDQDWVVSVFYTVIIPMINPIIYTLRNQDVKQALETLSFSNIPMLFRQI